MNYLIEQMKTKKRAVKTQYNKSLPIYNYPLWIEQPILEVIIVFYG